MARVLVEFSRNGASLAFLLGRYKIVRGAGPMDVKLDIFKRLPDGQPLCVKAVDSLEEARAQLARLAASAPGEYFIYSVKQGRVLQTNFAVSA